jgi:hypothetical protein
VAVAGVAGAVAPSTTHFAAMKSFHAMPAGTVLAAFMAFHAALQFCIKLPDGVVACAAAAGAAGAIFFVAFAGTAAAGAVAGACVAAASAAHWCFMKSVHFTSAPKVFAAFAALNLVLHSVMKFDFAAAFIESSGAAQTIKATATDMLRSVCFI